MCIYCFDDFCSTQCRCSLWYPCAKHGLTCIDRRYDKYPSVYLTDSRIYTSIPRGCSIAWMAWSYRDPVCLCCDAMDRKQHPHAYRDEQDARCQSVGRVPLYVALRFSIWIYWNFIRGAYLGSD